MEENAPYAYIRTNRLTGRVFVDDERTVLYCVDGEFHRDDAPAILTKDGYRAWYRYGQRHRDGGPAVEAPDGYKAWYWRGFLHRDDGPAVERPDGTKLWYRFGELVDCPSGQEAGA